MPMLDRAELVRFLGEHLTAQAVMVPAHEPIDPHQPIHQAYDHLERHQFDYALVGGGWLLVLSQQAAKHAAATTPSRTAGKVAQSPRRSHVIERTLPLREVTDKLRDDPHPLLVVGGDTITHIITRADFAGVAGTAAVLMTLLTLDAKLNALLLDRRDAAWNALKRQQQRLAEDRQKKAADRHVELDSPLHYLSMTMRLQLIRDLGLAEQFGLGTRAEHETLTEIRNDAAHHGSHDPMQALRVLDLAERILDQVDNAHQQSMRGPALPVGYGEARPY
jgi:hypothetical protein